MNTQRSQEEWDHVLGVKLGLCECGHRWHEHATLPGHPHGAEDCYGDEDCDCGRFKRAAVDVA